MAEMSLGGVLLTALNCAPLIEYADCGENIRHNSQNRKIYHIIKDARGMARSAERTVIPGEILKPSSHWETVHNLGWQIITSASLDIEILAWLIEAELRLGGFRGLRTMYEKLTVIVAQHWDALRSVDDDDEAERFSPFAGLNGLGAEGALVQPLRLASLLPAGKFGEMSLWDFQLGQRPGEAARREKLHQAASEAGRQAMSAHLCDVTGALMAFVIDASARYIVAWKLCSTMKADEEKDTLDLALARQGSTRQLSRTGPDHYQITARPILPAIWLTGSRRRRWGTCAAQRTVRRRKAKLSACIRRSKSRVLLDNSYLPGELERQIATFIEHYHHARYHESLDNLTPADVAYARANIIMAERERIKQRTREDRRLQHQLQVA